MKPIMYINKGSCNYRWQILSITVWINMGAYFCFDHPASLHNTIKNHFKGNIAYNLCKRIDG